MNDSQWQQTKINCEAGLVPSREMVDAMVAEIERLRADNAALVAAVNAIIHDGRVAEILQRAAPEAFEGLVDALFVD